MHFFSLLDAYFFSQIFLSCLDIPQEIPASIQTSNPSHLWSNFTLFIMHQVASLRCYVSYCDTRKCHAALIQFSQFQIFWKRKSAKSFARTSGIHFQTAELNVFSKNLLVFFAPSSIFDFWLSDVLLSKYFLKNVKKQNENSRRDWGRKR